jgi:tetratricopeptide (TPR) repeat protein
MLIDRGAYAQAIAMAERGAAASDRFIEENLSAYQLTGKSQGSFARGRATAADLVGWAWFAQKDYGKARQKLEEAARLSQDQDVVNQFHLGELARAEGDAAGARTHYLNALSLAGGPPPVRQRATQALTAMAAAAPPPGGFDAWLDAELSRRRDERRESALKSLVDRPLPKLTLKTVDGRSYDTSGLQGKVLLLNFFASW